MINKNELIKEYSQYSNHLGNYYPYYIEINNSSDLFLDIKSALKEMKTKIIDVVGIVEILNKSYLLGDRTLVKGISRVPWMTSFYDFHRQNQIFMEIPPHKNDYMDEKTLAESLKKALKKELKMYISQKKVVGVLLSGGLDSRIVAGLLKEMQLSGEYQGQVIVITWGMEQSRDLIYSRDISKRYNWEIVHLDISPEVLKENIYLAGKMGAEFSASHLHAMNQVANIISIEAVIAGSYGDGVGRGEFSGKKIVDLKAIVKGNLNPYGILRGEVVKETRMNILNDAFSYRKYIKREKKYQYYEIEQEIHYMRRKLQACMNIIGCKKPLYQLFTAPESFGLMWSIEPKFRNDLIYKEIIQTLPGSVDSIPWARNSKTIYGDSNYSIVGEKEFHQYGKWLRNDLYDEISNLVLSDEIKSLEVFNEKSLKTLLKVWQKQNTISISKLDEIFSWIASLAVFMSSYNITNNSTYEENFNDKINYLFGVLDAKIYAYIRGKMRE